MAYLGRPQRCVCVSKNFESNVTIMAVVTRPDGVVLGPYLMTEFQNVFFKGMYYFDLITNPADPSGMYTMVFVTPDGMREPYKIELDDMPGELAMVINMPIATDIVGELEDVSEISGVIEDYSELSASISDIA